MGVVVGIWVACWEGKKRGPGACLNNRHKTQQPPKDLNGQRTRRAGKEDLRVKAAAGGEGAGFKRKSSRRCPKNLMVNLDRPGLAWLSDTRKGVREECALQGPVDKIDSGQAPRINRHELLAQHGNFKCGFATSRLPLLRVLSASAPPTTATRGAECETIYD